MTYIRLACPKCGSIDVPANKILIHLDVDKKTRRIVDSFILFNCPKCSAQLRAVTKDNIKFLRQIRELGARYAVKEDIKQFIKSIVPDKITYSITSKEKPSKKNKKDPPLTYNDLIDMHFLLEKIDNVDDLFDTLKKREDKEE